MSEQIKNINPWVEKLEQISIPGAEEQWSAMKTLLDKEMPVTKRKKPGIWFWLIISLLLICSLFFGVLHLSKLEQKKNVLSDNTNAVNDKMKKNSLINSDDSLKQNKSVEKENKNELKKPEAKISSTENADKNKSSISKITDDLKTTAALNKVKSKKDEKITTENENSNTESVSPKPEKKIIANNNRNKKTDDSKIENKQENLLSKTSSSNSRKGNIISNHKRSIADNEKNQTKNNPGTTLSQQTKKINSDKKRNNKTYIESNSTAQINANRESLNDKQSDKKKNISSATNNFDSSSLVINDQPLNANKDVVQPSIKDSASITRIISQLHSDSTKKIDTANKQLAKINKTDSVNNKKKKNIVLAAGIGFNQSFPISGQNFSNLSANGGNNILTDYIPIPFFRVSLKKIYFQIEAQFNSPQYTKDLVAKSRPTVNSINSSLVVTAQDSGTIKKLYYFNLPISVHYNFFKNFYAGAGLQFSMLTNGVGSFQSRLDSATNRHSTFILTSSATGNLKSNSVFDELKKNELRFLFDVNCQWKNLIFGARYTQALSNFIDEQISASQTTKASNSSLQFYLQYILWKNKKTGKSLSK